MKGALVGGSPQNSVANESETAHVREVLCTSTNKSTHVCVHTHTEMKHTCRHTTEVSEKEDNKVPRTAEKTRREEYSWLMHLRQNAPGVLTRM